MAVTKELMIQVIQALSETLNLDASTSAITGDTRLKEDLGIDSMTSLIFLLNLEKAIEGFRVDPETLLMDHLTNVATISDYVAQQLNVSA